MTTFQEAQSITATENDEEFFQRMRIASKIQDALKKFEQKMEHAFNSDEFFESAMRLCFIFGEDIVIDGLSISENGLVRVVRDKDNIFPFLYEVRTSSFCAYSYYIYEGINFCKCGQFTDEVVNKETAFTVC